LASGARKNLSAKDGSALQRVLIMAFEVAVGRLLAGM
jgi:hypothetical protein